MKKVTMSTLGCGHDATAGERKKEPPEQTMWMVQQGAKPVALLLSGDMELAEAPAKALEVHKKDSPNHNEGQQ